MLTGGRTMPENELRDELRRIMPERTRLLEKLAALDRRIAELAGEDDDGKARKPAKKTLSRDNFRRLCGA